MNTEKAIKITAAVLCCTMLIGAFQIFYLKGALDTAKDSFSETAQRLQAVIDDNEKDLYTDTMNYDAYKAALNAAMHTLAEDEQLVHINVGFGSLDRGLKYINDTYGHLNGGPCILDFAKLLKDVFPSEDGWVICHRGGSGFLVFGVGQFSEESLLGYYEILKERWHDTPHVTSTGNGTVEGMSLLFLAAVGPECGTHFSALRDELVYKKLSLRDLTNCGYCIQTSPDHFISNVDIDEEKYMEE